MARPPNVVFILGDDWGWGDLGCFGHAQLRTPFLDQLAAEGTRYTQFYVAASVCSPSRASFLTGRFPASIGVHSVYDDREDNRQRGMTDWLDPQLSTLPRLLQQAGYVTAHFGKWHLGHLDGAPPPGDYGFHVYRSTNSTGPGWDDPHAGPTHGQNPSPRFRPHSSERIVDEALRFIEEYQNQPFYVQLWLLDPHAILNPTDEQMAPYRQLSPMDVEHVGAPTIYYSVVTNADRQIGRLLQRLEELHLSEDTIVLFTGDNGPEDILIRNASHSGVGSPGPFRGRKRSLYEGGVRLPLIVRWPGHTPAGGVDNDSVLSSADFLPTVSALVGATPSLVKRCDGEDRSLVLLGRQAERTTPLLWEWRFAITGHVINRSPMLAIREGHWKLLLNPDRSRVELYDIPRDPMELDNQARRQPGVVKGLAERALAWQAGLPLGPVSPTAGSNAYPWPS